jgi:hypothetical protein
MVFFERNTKFTKKSFNQINSIVALARALYSALVLERKKVACLQALHDTTLEPKKIAKPSVERRSSRLPFRSAFKKALRRVDGKTVYS